MANNLTVCYLCVNILAFAKCCLSMWTAACRSAVCTGYTVIENSRIDNILTFQTHPEGLWLSSVLCLYGKWIFLIRSLQLRSITVFCLFVIISHLMQTDTTCRWRDESFFHNMLLRGFVFIVSPASQWCDDAPWYNQQLSAALPSVIITHWELRMCRWLELGFAQTTDVVIVIIIFFNKDCSLDDWLQSSCLYSTFLGGLLGTYTVGGRAGGGVCLLMT